MIHTRAEDKNANEPGKLISEVPMVKLKFKVLVQLHPGDNEIMFDFLGVKDTLRISFNQVSSPYTVRYRHCHYCQALVRSPKSKFKTQRTWADNRIIWTTNHHQIKDMR